MIKHTNKFAKRATILVGGLAAIFGLSGCTKSFCTNQDKANQLYAAYGNIFSDSVTQDSADGDSSIVQPSENQTMSDYALTTRNKNREAVYNTLTTTYGYALPDKAFQDFITNKAEAEAEDTKAKWMDGTFASLPDDSAAKDIAFHVALYAGIDENNQVAPLWENFDAWYDEAVADPNIGILKTPSSGYIATLKKTLETTIAQNYSCITPTDKEINQGGTNIYIQGKSWGQAFKQFGFLEGLFVYPFAWIVHSISENLGDTGWAQLLAIFVVTLLVRSITVISSIYQSKTQARQQALQPQLNELAKKYPQAKEDPEQRRAMTLEQSKLMKKNKVHPLLPMLFLFIQFPLFICIWSALQGSAALADGSLFGLSLTTKVSTCITAYGATPGAIVGVLIFILMSVANILSSCTGLWLNTWRTKNFGSATPTQYDANGNPVDPNQTMKFMTYGMMVFVIIMGWGLPAAMGIYWFIGAVMSIMQLLITEAIQTKTRHRIAANTGDGTTLAAIRRSKHHSPNGKKADKKNKSDKPLWR